MMSLYHHQESPRFVFSWEIIHRLFGAALIDFSFWYINYVLVLYNRQHLEYDVLSFGRKILWSWIGIWGSVVISSLFWKKISRREANNNDYK